MIETGYYLNKPGDDAGRDVQTKYARIWQPACWEFIQKGWREIGIQSESAVYAAERAQDSY